MSPSTSEIPGYGPRASDPRIPVEDLDGRRIRRSEFAGVLISAGLLCGAWSAFVIWQAAGRGYAPTRLPPMALGSVVMLCLGAAYAAVPLLVMRGTTLVVRSPPWSRARVVAAWDVAWRPGAAYVGRYLVYRSIDGKRHRLPLWMLTRRDQRALFAWLDAHADGPRGSDAP